MSEQKIDCMHSGLPFEMANNLLFVACYDFIGLGFDESETWNEWEGGWKGGVAGTSIEVFSRVNSAEPYFESNTNC